MNHRPNHTTRASIMDPRMDPSNTMHTYLRDAIEKFEQDQLSAGLSNVTMALQELCRRLDRIEKKLGISGTDG